MATAFATHRPQRDATGPLDRARAVVCVVILALAAVTLGPTASAQAATGAADRAAVGQPVTQAEVVAAASDYAQSRGYRVAISVLDTLTGRLYHSGPHTSTFATESVVKVMIAARICVQGRMHGETAARAVKMITRSDDAIASSFYGSVGGDSLINWVKARWHVPGLGSPPHRAGWWGNTHVTSDGLVRLYAKLKADPKVGPWLLRTMHHARQYGSGGFYQWFGLHSAYARAAIKQGWGFDYDDWNNSADENSTGYVDNDRYAIALLARGAPNTYGAKIGDMLTHVARILLPGGNFPENRPSITSVSMRSASTTGGTTLVIRGHDFDGLRRVDIDDRPARLLHAGSPTRLTVRAPAHAAGRAYVRIVTTHGVSTLHNAAITYVPGPSIVQVSPATGSSVGGTRVTLTGRTFTHVVRVLFGGVPGRSVRVSSRRQLSAVAPAGVAGTVNIRVLTVYGESPRAAADRFTYVAPPAVSGLSVTSGPAAGGTSLVITGSGFFPGTTVQFDRTPATSVSVVSPTEIDVVSPRHAAGTVHVRTTTPYGRSAPTSTSEFVFGSS